MKPTDFETEADFVAAMRQINSFKNYTVPRIGACGIVPKGNRVLAIECAKGRGLVLPGGKFEVVNDKTYKSCAAREVYEETGVLVNNQDSRLVASLGCFDGYYVYFFKFPSYQYEELKSSGEGVPRFVTLKELVEKSMYSADYDILFGGVL